MFDTDDGYTTIGDLRAEIEALKEEVERLRTELIQSKLQLQSEKEFNSATHGIGVGGLADIIFRDDRIGPGIPEKMREIEENNRLQSSLAAAQEEIKLLQSQVIYGFYENVIPIYTNAADAHPELSELVTPEICTNLVNKIVQLKARERELVSRLMEYGQHKQDCLGWFLRDKTSCTCGLSALIEGRQ